MFWIYDCRTHQKSYWLRSFTLEVNNSVPPHYSIELNIKATLREIKAAGQAMKAAWTPLCGKKGDKKSVENFLIHWCHKKHGKYCYTLLDFVVLCFSDLGRSNYLLFMIHCRMKGPCHEQVLVSDATRRQEWCASSISTRNRILNPADVVRIFYKVSITTFR